MHTRWSRPAGVLLIATMAAVPEARRGPEILRATGGLPAHVAGAFTEPLAYEIAAGGRVFVFDRRAHTVYALDAGADEPRKIVQIGFEEGRILQPSAFASAPDGSFVVADAPNAVERVQIFRPDGVKVGGFGLPGRNAARITLGSLVLNGVGSLHPDQPAGNRRAHHGVHPVRPGHAHNRQPAPHRARRGPGRASGAQCRHPPGGPDGRLLLRVPGRRADVPEIRP